MKTAPAVLGESNRLLALAGLAFAWSGVAIMWLFWVCFVVFLAQPADLMSSWPLPSVDRGGWIESTGTALAIDVILIALFGLQHSLMARPAFNAWLGMPRAFERCLFVHMANAMLFMLVIFWQPIPVELWSLPKGWPHDLAVALFALGWLILFAGAYSFGILELLGVAQMHAWARGEMDAGTRLKTGRLYRWLRHPMYVGVLMGVWITPLMTVGHLVLAAGLTLYVLIGMHYEERDLARRFGRSYARWRAAPGR